MMPLGLSPQLVQIAHSLDFHTSINYNCVLNTSDKNVYNWTQDILCFYIRYRHYKYSTIFLPFSSLQIDVCRYPVVLNDSHLRSGGTNLATDHDSCLSTVNGQSTVLPLMVYVALKGIILYGDVHVIRTSYSQDGCTICGGWAEAGCRTCVSYMYRSIKICV